MAVTLPGLVSYHLVGDKLVPRVSCEAPLTGELPYYDGVLGKWTNLSTSTTDFVLTTQGVGNAPQFKDIKSLYTNVFGKTITVDVGHQRATNTRGSLSKYDANSPWAGIAEAMAAAVSGDAILVYPGNYTLSGTLTVKDGISLIGFGEISRITGRIEFTAGATGIYLYNLSVQNTNDLCLFGNVVNSIRIEKCDFLSSYTTQITKFVVEFAQGTITLLGCFVRFSSTDTGVTINNAGLIRFSGTAALTANIEFCDLIYASADDDDETRLIYDTNTSTSSTVRVVNCRSDFSNTSTTPISLHHFYYASTHTTRRFITQNFCNFSWTNAGTNNFLVFAATISGGSGGSIHIYDNTVIWTSNLPDTSVFLGRSSGSNDSFYGIDNNLKYFNDFFIAQRYYLAGDLGLFNILSISNSDRVSIGRPDARKEFSSGEGYFSIDGMIVLTTNNTASGVSDGGGFVNQTSQAISPTGTFSFQGTTANHTILIGSELQTSAGYVKYWGYLIDQVTAAVEITKRSFAFEIWDGAAWVAVGSMAIQKANTYRYANEVFIRANNIEMISLGIGPDTTWVTKTINGFTGFWTRIRITNNLTTAPTFNSIRLSRSSCHIDQYGIHYFTGISRYFDYEPHHGGAFGNSGAVDGNFTAGTGAGAQTWSHQVRQGRHNGDGDFSNMALRIPAGVDTSLPVEVVALFETSTASAATVTLTMSLLPVEAVGVLEADPTGGIVPVARTEANTELANSKASPNTAVTLDNTPAGYIRQARFTGFSIANYYEGDAILLKFNLTTRNGGVIELLALTVRFGKLMLGENTLQV